MNSLILCDTEIHHDEDGRFSINDLHRAALAQGIAKDIRPNEWLSLDRTKELAEILITENQGNCPISSKAGRYGGTYVAKELVYEYAMWVSPKFHLQVIRAYDALVTGAAQHSPSAKQLCSAFSEAFAACRSNGMSEALAAQVANSATEAETGVLLLSAQSVVHQDDNSTRPIKQKFDPSKSYSKVKSVADLGPGESIFLPAWDRLGYKDAPNARNAIYGFARRYGFRVNVGIKENGISVTRQGKMEEDQIPLF